MTNRQRTTWTESEVELVIQLRDDAKLDWYEIAARMGRTAKGAKNRYYFFKRSPEDQAKFLQAKKDYRKTYRSRGGKSCMEVRAERPRDIPDETIREWQTRSMAPRTLTGSIFGDPPIGYSALDMRGQQ